MRGVSLVFLSFFVPALFSSLLAVSALAESEHAQRSSNSGIASVEASSFLGSDWEQEAPDTHDVEVDNDTLASHVFFTSDTCTSGVSYLLGKIKQIASLTNSIRGPPAFS